MKHAYHDLAWMEHPLYREPVSRPAPWSARKSIFLTLAVLSILTGALIATGV